MRMIPILELVLKTSEKLTKNFQLATGSGSGSGSVSREAGSRSGFPDFQGTSSHFQDFQGLLGTSSGLSKFEAFSEFFSRKMTKFFSKQERSQVSKM